MWCFECSVYENLSCYTGGDFDYIKELSTSHCSGLDGIDPFFAGEFVHLISSPLVLIINCSFETGLFPKELKIAKVIPLHKSGDVNRITNYRPISILPYFSKLFEKAMFSRIYNFLMKFSLVNDRQFGFRKAHSTFMPLMLLYSKIAEAAERGEYTIGIFLDLAKAFDTVDQNLLIVKLDFYGFRGCLGLAQRLLIKQKATG